MAQSSPTAGRMGKFIIEPHFRLHEWVAEEKGYFKDEGLDYEFREQVRNHRRQGPRQGRQGRRVPVARGGATVECVLRLPLDGRRCGFGRPWQALSRRCYSVSPAGMFVPADSPIKHPEQLAGVPISVGYQSGSHYSTIQALEQYMPADKIKLNYADGMLFARMDRLVEGKAPAARCSAGPTTSPSSSATGR